MEHSNLHERLALLGLRLALCVGASLAFGTFASLRADEIRFHSTENGAPDIETRSIPKVGDSDEAERFDVLDAALDHSQRQAAEERLDETVEYAARNPNASYGTVQTFTPVRTYGTSRTLEPETARAVEPRQAESSEQYASNFTSARGTRNDRVVFNSAAYAPSQSKAIEDAARDMLDLKDIRQFSEPQGRAVEESFDDEAYLAEINEDVANEEKLDAITTSDVADECFYALDPFSSMFIEYEPTAAWTEAILEFVEPILYSLEAPNAETERLLQAFSDKIAEADALQDALIEADAQTAKNGSAQKVKLEERYNLAQRLELLESFKKALERHAYLWKASVDHFAAKASGQLAPPQEFSTEQLHRLMRETSAVRGFFGDSQNGMSWRASFDVDRLADDLERVLELQATQMDDDAFGPIDSTLQDAPERTNDELTQAETLTNDELAELGRPLSRRELVVKERGRRMRFLRDRLNSVAYKLEKTPMTPQQRQVFQRPTLASWAELAETYACDQANGKALLYEFECYETTAGGDAGRSLQQLALRMATSKSEECRKFGRAIDAIYDNPNVKAYVSEALINRLIPIRDPEFGVVQDRILNNPVAGSRRVDTFVSIELVPNQTRLLMNLVVNGRISTTTSSEVFSAKLHNQSYANYIGKKALEWQDGGLAYSPASVGANSSNQLAGVETNIDFVPLVGGVAREVVRAQYEARQDAIRSQMQAKVIAEARTRIDAEADERFDALNARMQANFFARLKNLGLSLKTQRSKTTDDWLLASLRLGSDYSLGCQTTEPATLDGAFADVKIHESSVNAYLAQLGLGGRESTPRETLDYLADKLERPGLRDVEIEDSDLRFTFAKTDPVVARFFEDQIQFRLKFAKMSLGAQDWDDLEVVVAFRPSVTPDGRPTITRDGVVEIYGPTNIRSLMPLRAIFSKVFPAQKSFDLALKIFETDERFAGLQLGLCRVSRGWFAVSVIRDESAL